MEPKLIDHLFRHHYGKMVSVLTRIFGLSHLETIEDAVQDTFIKATTSWKNKQPDNPEAWLTRAARNRVVDIFRKLNAEKKRIPKFSSGLEAIAINDLFLDDEIEDSQLRMIFTACHPSLKATDRISYALRTVSGFNSKEIASALLTKEDTVKKRLIRARKAIRDKNLSFQIPQGKELPLRLESVMEVLYLIFNEGFYSSKKDRLVRKELCGEAVRLCQILLKNKITRTPAAYALFALMCFHSARLDSRINSQNELLDLKNQDRSKWHFPLVELGNNAMNKAVEEGVYSCYHYEAAIAAEHLRAPHFEQTDWDKILLWYERLQDLQPMPITVLNMAVVQIQRNAFDEAFKLLQQITPDSLEQRAYLYHGSMAEFYWHKKMYSEAHKCLDSALSLVTNQFEKDYLQKKKLDMLL